jgi:hypothetical protein
MRAAVRQLPAGGSAVSEPFAYALQGIDIAGMQRQLTEAPGRIQAASASGIAAVEQDINYAEQLLGACVQQPAAVKAALMKAYCAEHTEGTAEVMRVCLCWQRRLHMMSGGVMLCWWFGRCLLGLEGMQVCTVMTSVCIFVMGQVHGYNDSIAASFALRLQLSC